MGGSVARRCRWVRLLLLAATALALSGCLKLDARLTVRSDNTISGDYVVAYLKSAAKPSTGFGVARQLLVSRGSATASKYDDGQYTGTKYMLSGVALSDLAGFSAVVVNNRPTGTIAITREGSDFVVSGSFDFRDPKPIHRTPAQVRQAQDAFRVRVQLTFPGNVEAADGTVTGRTVTWTMPPFVLTALHARAAAVAPGDAGRPAASPAGAVSPSRRSVPLLLGGSMAVLAVLVAAFLALRRWRRRRSGETASADPRDFAWVVGDRPPRGPAGEPEPPPDPPEPWWQSDPAAGQASAPEGWPGEPAVGGAETWPAQPAVGGAETWPAQPAVGGAETWPAQPAVGGAETWPAQPAVGGAETWPAQPAVAGPGYPAGPGPDGRQHYAQSLPGGSQSYPMGPAAGQPSLPPVGPDGHPLYQPVPPYLPLPPYLPVPSATGPPASVGPPASMGAPAFMGPPPTAASAPPAAPYPVPWAAPPSGPSAHPPVPLADAYGPPVAAPHPVPWTGTPSGPSPLPPMPSASGRPPSPTAGPSAYPPVPSAGGQAPSPAASYPAAPSGGVYRPGPTPGPPSFPPVPGIVGQASSPAAESHPAGGWRTPPAPDEVTQWDPAAPAGAESVAGPVPEQVAPNDRASPEPTDRSPWESS